MARRGRKIPEPRLIDDRNRVSLPRDVLQALDVDPGDFVTFIVDEHGGVRIHKLTLTVAPPQRPGGQPMDGFSRRSANPMAG